MGVLPCVGVLDSSLITLSSSVGTMSPATCQVASKEASKASIEQAVEVTKPTILFLQTQSAS